jgi:hypothetical protein
MEPYLLFKGIGKAAEGKKMKGKEADGHPSDICVCCGFSSSSFLSLSRSGKEEGGGGQCRRGFQMAQEALPPNGPPIPPIYCSSRAAKGNGKCKRRRRKKGEEEEEGN